MAGGTSFVQDLRAARLTPLSPEEQARTLQQLLFVAPPSDAAMDTAGPSGPQRLRDEPVAFLHVECPNFSAAARQDPKAAWRHLLLSLSKEESPPLRLLDILPMSATKAEIFIPSDLPRSTAEVCPDGSISIDGEGLSQAGCGLSEQLLPGLPASNLTGLPRQALAVRSLGTYPDGRIHALPLSHEVQGHSPDGGHRYLVFTLF